MFKRRTRRINLGLRPSKATVLLRMIIYRKDLVNEFMSRFTDIDSLDSYFAGLVAGDGYLRHKLSIKGNYVVLSLRNIEIYQIDQNFLLYLKKLLNSMKIRRVGIHVHSYRGKHTVYALSVNPRELAPQIYPYKLNYKWNILDLYYGRADMLSTFYFIYLDRYLLRHALGHIIYGTSILERHELDFLHKHLFDQRLDAIHGRFRVHRNLYLILEDIIDRPYSIMCKLARDLAGYITPFEAYIKVHNQTRTLYKLLNIVKKIVYIKTIEI